MLSYPTKGPFFFCLGLVILMLTLFGQYVVATEI